MFWQRKLGHLKVPAYNATLSACEKAKLSWGMVRYGVPGSRCSNQFFEWFLREPQHTPWSIFQASSKTQMKGIPSKTVGWGSGVCSRDMLESSYDRWNDNFSCKGLESSNWNNNFNVLLEGTRFVLSSFIPVYLTFVTFVDDASSFPSFNSNVFFLGFFTFPPWNFEEHQGVFFVPMFFGEVVKFEKELG